MIHPQGADWLGYLAAVLVFCSFYAKTVVPLRLVAITSNVAFIGYAAAEGLYPVLLLHLVLLPLNCLRLIQLRLAARRVERDRERASGGREDSGLPADRGPRRAVAGRR